MKFFIAEGVSWVSIGDLRPMNYRNTEMKVDQLVNYFNEEKINLSPAFQRGHVWPLRTRRKLIQNIVQGRPIPAIFLYKEASGSRYSYNILDGKQRLESLILFVGNKNAAFSVRTWSKYFFADKVTRQAHFWIELDSGKKKSFADLDEATIRDLQEYVIPTVEINLTDDSHLDEIINLFVDINQQGVAVGRFDIVKAMGNNNRLLKSVFDLLALKEKRAQDVFYKAKNNDFTNVLKRLEVVAKLTDPNSRVDRMWERLLEITLFSQTKKHRKPVDILKSFISGGRESERFPALKLADQRGVRQLFAFVKRAYATSALASTSLATDQTRFYTLITSLIATDTLKPMAETDVIRRLAALGKLIDRGTTAANKKTKASLEAFLTLAKDRTTDTPRREERQKIFLELLSGL